eukprot:TRINITY_DN13861_c0_g1_i1.p1 TRINITY_DN13861_c0_g1~~TRINITY_DN13861_c0_g1_i1.p1  ORF type:complete len:341 (+),score=80.06 TRINITY_DN13861_c0_g1_i1:223-1245(+)
MLVFHLAPPIFAKKTLEIMYQFEGWVNEAIQHRKPIPAVMKHLTEHDKIVYMYFGSVAVAFVTDTACLLGVVFIDFDSTGDDLAPYIFVLGMVSFLWCLDILLFLWIPFALHRIPLQHWPQVRAKLVGLVPWCKCWLPEDTEDLEAGDLDFSSSGVGLVWDESQEHTSVKLTEIGSSIAKNATAERGNQLGTGTSLDLIVAVAHKAQSYEFVWVDHPSVGAGDVIRFTQCEFSVGAKRGENGPHYAVVTQRKLDDELEMCEQSLGGSNVVTLSTLNLATLVSGEARVFRAMTPEERNALGAAMAEPEENSTDMVAPMRESYDTQGATAAPELMVSDKMVE